MGAGGFTAVPDDLRSASAEIAAATDRIAEFKLEASGRAAYGHDQLHATVSDLCSTILRAVATFERDAMAAREALRIAARKYAETDENASAAITQAGGGL